MYRSRRYEFPAAQHKVIGYPYRVWIFSILITPFLEILFLSEFDKGSHSKFTFSNDLLISVSGYLIIVFLLIVLSIPAMLIYLPVFWKLIDSTLPKLCIKFFLSIITLSCVSLTNYLLTGNFLYDFFEDNGPENLSILFSAVFLIMSLVFSLKEK